jgi:hypothetical protein
MGNGEDILKKTLVAVLFCATAWDAFTTLYGTQRILGEGCAPISAAVLFAVLVTVLLLNTERILEMDSEGFQGVLSKFLWFLAIVYDLYTAWTGNHRFLVQELDLPRTVVLAGLTLLATGSPMLLSYHVDEWR